MLILTTSDFKNGGWIPDKNSGYGEDRSPEFHIEGIDTKAKTMILTLDDLGHPVKPGYNHWIRWNVAPVEQIPGGIAKGSVIVEPIHIEQGVAYGKHCYRGPKPPFNWKHEYLFTLYNAGLRTSSGRNSEKARHSAACRWAHSSKSRIARLLSAQTQINGVRDTPKDNEKQVKA